MAREHSQLRTEEPSKATDSPSRRHVALHFVKWLEDAIEKKWSPSGLLSVKLYPHHHQNRREFVARWAIVTPIVLFVLLLLPRTTWWQMAIAAIALVDLYASLLRLILVRRKIGSGYEPIRNVLLLPFNFLEVVFAYAILYLGTRSVEFTSNHQPVVNWGTATYFSIITFSTVGFGDIAPANATGRLLTSLEVISAMVFMALVLGGFVSLLVSDNSQS